jgi:hypothetical protein
VFIFKFGSRFEVLEFEVLGFELAGSGFGAR